MRKGAARGLAGHLPPVLPVYAPHLPQPRRPRLENGDKEPCPCNEWADLLVTEQERKLLKRRVEPRACTRACCSPRTSFHQEKLSQQEELGEWFLIRAPATCRDLGHQTELGPTALRQGSENSSVNRQIGLYSNYSTLLFSGKTTCK